MDMRGQTSHKTVTVARLKDRLNEVDDDLLVIFEPINKEGNIVASYTLDSVQQRGGFFVLQSIEGYPDD